MQNPAHLQELDYALAVVNSRTVAATYLTPKTMSFSTYASTTTGVGCLSVYMQTKESGNDAGSPSPGFVLPGSKNLATFPIPESYTASIIIRNELLRDQFFANALNSTKDGKGQSFFRKVTPDTSIGEGFKFITELNASVRGTQDFAEGGSWHTTVSEADWDLGRNPLTIIVDKNMQCSTQYSFSDRLHWHNPFPGSWGNTYFDLSMDQTVGLISKSTDTGITAVINVSDWKRWVHEWNPSVTDRMTGATSNIPTEVMKGLNGVPLPNVRSEIRLDHSATTNIFAPGQNIFQAAGPDKVFSPYDVLILGNISHPVTNVQTVSGTPVASINSADADDAGLGKNAADLAHDLLTGQPIFSQSLAAIATGDSNALDKLLTSKGYMVTAEDLQAVLATADPGPNFQVRTVGGIYGFDEPQDLKSRQMGVDPTTGR